MSDDIGSGTLFKQLSERIDRWQCVHRSVASISLPVAEGNATTHANGRATAWSRQASQSLGIIPSQHPKLSSSSLLIFLIVELSLSAANAQAKSV